MRAPANAARQSLLPRGSCLGHAPVRHGDPGAKTSALEPAARTSATEPQCLLDELGEKRLVHRRPHTFDDRGKEAASPEGWLGVARELGDQLVDVVRVRVQQVGVLQAQPSADGYHPRRFHR